MHPLRVEKKRYVYYVATCLAFAALLARFAYLQIFQWQRYFKESERNRIREVTEQPVRGILLDRNNEVLVDNRPAYSLRVVPYELLRSQPALHLLADILGEPAEKIRAEIRQRRISNFRPLKLRRHVSFQTVSQVEELELDLPGVDYEIEPTRYYPSGVRAPHLFGYLGEVTAEEIEQYKERRYEQGDVIGKKGLERVYDDLLRGEKGYRYVEVDALGREVRQLTELKSRPARPGKNLVLTIDAGLQRFLEQRMESFRGGAVVLDVHTGDVLALVSKPDYDPELFAKPISPEVWQALINDPAKPLYDRMIQSVYPPGSTFKLIIAMAGLETGRIKPADKVYCPGWFRLGRRIFECWKHDGHGRVNLLQAIEHSCNVYFYQMALRVELDDWARYARFFRFGRPTGIDLTGENGGQVPDRAYLDERYGKGRWTDGLRLNLAIGQGDLLVTPLQMAQFAMALANNGLIYKPRLLLKVVDPLTGNVRRNAVDSLKVPGVSLATYALIKKGMFAVVNGDRGTAKVLRRIGVTAAGKTGTAQNPHGEPHAWFIGYAPAELPEIAIAVIVENGGGGGSVAAPVAADALKYWFSRRSSRNRLSTVAFSKAALQP
jgi:penicillin-binding protein 2